ncbi:hypothetical protein RHGRI_000486 [Rhododendron griersonianum]|uniref:Uncharacterized protein n=1 Tax=Rhododendron griersonianum TaxID=479676 RepID=A0AAV6LHR4_9ERIC|nr:hypothetical protein RHGRI_000486 [Rhododendron griersonianum]
MIKSPRAESTCAALVFGSISSFGINHNCNALPLLIGSVGIPPGGSQVHFSDSKTLKQALRDMVDEKTLTWKSFFPGKMFTSNLLPNYRVLHQHIAENVIPLW